MFILAVICYNITTSVTGTNYTTTTKTVTVTNVTRIYANGKNTTTTSALTNINVTEAIFNYAKGKTAFNDIKEKTVKKNDNNTTTVYSNATKSVPYHASPTAKPWSPTEESNAQTIANELKLLKKLTAILPNVLNEKMNSNQTSANETAKKDLEVFEQFSLSHYLDPEAEVVVFRKNERSQRQISDFPPQIQTLNTKNRTETQIFKLMPQMKNVDIDNNTHRTVPTAYDEVDRTGTLISDAPPQFRGLDKDNESQKLISGMPTPDFNPILHISQCNSCIASLNKMNWNIPEPIKTANYQQFDIIQSYPLHILNTNVLKTQTSYDNDKETYMYLSPSLGNPHIFQGYRRINHVNKNYHANDDNPTHRNGMDNSFQSKNKNIFESKIGAQNTIFLDVENNPYNKIELAHSTPNKMPTNVPDLSNMYPWLIGSPPLHIELRSQPLPAVHSLLMVNEPESNIDLKSATPAPIDPRKFSINKDKFEYYDTLVNIISNKSKHREIKPVNLVADTSVNEQLIINLNELRNSLVELTPHKLVDRPGMIETENQQLLSDKKIESAPPIQYLKLDDNSAYSEKINREAEVIIKNEAEYTAQKRHSSANANQPFQTHSAVSNKNSENNGNAIAKYQYEFEVPPIEIDISKRRALDSKISDNLQRDLTEPLDMLIIQLLKANGFDKDKIDQFWPHLVALLANYMAYNPKSIPYYSPSRTSINSLKVQNINITNLPLTDNIRNVNAKDLSALNGISNVTNRHYIAQSNGSTVNNETTLTVNYNIINSIQNTIQSLLASHNVTNNSDTIPVSTTILLDVTDNDTNSDPKDIRRHLEIIKIENNANNASVLLINKKKYGEILKSLDSFSLERKKAYVTIVPTEKTSESLHVGRSKYNKTVDPTFLDKIFGNEYTPEKEVTIGPANEESLDTKDFLDNPQIFSALKKQTELMGKLLLKLRGESARKNAGKDFQDLIKEVEAKKHGTYTTEIIEDLNKRVGDETKTPPTTVMTMIDETEVRKALRNSPYVKRILKLSKLKRDRYFKGKKTAERKKY